MKFVDKLLAVAIVVAFCAILAATVGISMNDTHKGVHPGHWKSVATK